MATTYKCSTVFSQIDACGCNFKELHSVIKYVLFFLRYSLLEKTGTS